MARTNVSVKSEHVIHLKVALSKIQLKTGEKTTIQAAVGLLIQRELASEAPFSFLQN